MEKYKAFINEIEIPIREGLLTHTLISSHLSKSTGLINIVPRIHRSKVIAFHEYLTRAYPQAAFKIYWAAFDYTNCDSTAAQRLERIHYMF